MRDEDTEHPDELVRSKDQTPNPDHERATMRPWGRARIRSIRNTM